MTAEIVIMNQSAVAMAADSAVTINLPNGDKKIFNTANKLFALSKYQPVGIMVYNSSKLLGIDWEVIIKEYRRKLGRGKFNTLNEYYNDFIIFIINFDIISEESRDVSIEGHVHGVIQAIAEQFAERTKEQMAELNEVEGEEKLKKLNKILFEVLSTGEDYFGTNEIENCPLEKFNEFYGNMIEEIIADEIPAIDTVNNEILRRVIYKAIAKMDDYKGFTGIVISGYGHKELFPSTISFVINGLGKNFAISRILKTSSITLNNSASILPFAQSEMVASFMDGIDPMLSQFIHESIDYIFNKINDIIPLAEEQIKEINHEFSDAMEDFASKNFVNPILQIVSSLPKTDLAEMAESLVNLTAFKRHVSPDAETVGGPTDVAIISKSDGFIWIKRKHYFQPDLNRQFFYKYNLEDE
ncbi:hypothetical protein [Spirochaeta lutea]|uniref:Uncharacterized protein n=1 Tax=Spirochaeta lutea TaxID=1480694 RepID=A0A098R0Y4_9SPIO|nr:hypothetical protein [Spirochaeta lutea]KGE73313.1 hypothetical protein DC28_04610 [Spirochaeta lutea]